MQFKSSTFSFWISQGAYLLLMILAVVFFKDRMVSDTSYYFFKTVNTGFFHVEHDRYVLALAELPVYILAAFGCSLKVLAIALSLWHLLFFYSIGLIVYVKYKNTYAWLLLLLLQLVGVSYGFVCPIFEQFYGTALAVLFYVVISPKITFTRWALLFNMCLFAMIIMSHPFNVILVLFLMSMDFTSFKSWKKYVPYLLLIPVFILFKKLTASEYESGKMNWIFDVKHNKTYEMLFQKEHLVKRALFLMTYYKEVLVALALLVFYYFKNKLFYKLFVLISFFGVALLLINFSYNIEEISRYNEQVYYLIVPIILIPFVLDLFSKVKTRWVEIGLSMLIILTIANRIWIQYGMGIKYTDKYNLVSSWVQKAQLQTGSKFYIFKKDYPDLQQMMDWDIPYYSLFISAMEKMPKQVTIFPIEEHVIEVESIAPNEYWFRAGEKEKISSLNKQYFHLTDTAGAYVELK